MLDADQFTRLIIRPALKIIGLDFRAAEELLLGTALQESRLTYLHQLGGGPALGLFQMEPGTHDDIWTNYLWNRPEFGFYYKPIVSRDANTAAGNGATRY